MAINNTSELSQSKSVFHLGQLTPHNETSGGKRIKATKENFPKLKGMSLYRLTLYPKGIREPHWHANADELGYCMKGEVLVNFFGSGGIKESFTVKAGEVFLVPSGYIHSIENVGENSSELIIQFSHEQPEDFPLSSTFGMFSDAVLGNTWNLPGEVFKKLKRSTKESFATLRTTPLKIPPESPYSSNYRYDLLGSSPLISTNGGSARVARKNTWPILRHQALYSLILNNSGMREPHWHPETAEMGYIEKGHGRMSILNAEHSIDTYEMKEGDIYFIPKAYPHHIENLGQDDLHILIFFDQTMPEDIGFTASVKSFSDDVLGSEMGISPTFFQALPRYYDDLFIVDRINPLD